MTAAAQPLPITSEITSERPHWWRQLFWASFLSAYFIVVYGFCNGFTEARKDAGETIPTFYWEWERYIPLIPAFIIPYMSIDLFFFAAPFLCTDLRELRTHGKRVLLAITIAGVCFILLPLQYGHRRPELPGFLGYIFGFLHSFDYPYNLAPSLHIALRSLIWVVFVRHTFGLTRWGVRIWLILVGLSTLFVMQHHVIDLITGQMLAMLCFFLIPDAIAPSEQVLGQGERVRMNIKVGILYSAGMLVCLAAGLMMPRFGSVMFWPAFSLAIIALGYFGLGPEIFHKRNGCLPITTRWVLGPFLAGNYLSWIAYRRRLPAYNEVAPGVLLGRWLSPQESREAIADGVTAVLDLTAEFSETRALLTLPYRNVQIFDLTCPTRAQLADAVAFIKEHAGKEKGKLLVHCKLGCSRGSAVIAAYLLAEGKAKDVDDAIAQITRARPRACVSNACKDVLRGFIDSHTP